MKIGIVGAGNIGATLARKFAAQGHEIKLANSQGPDTLHDLARNLGASAVSAEDAVLGVDVVVLSIPFAKYADLVNIFDDVPDDVVVIDTSNYYPDRDGSICEVDDGKPESVWVSEQIGRPVIKAWNAAMAATLAEKEDLAGESERIALPVAGDDTKAKATAMALVEATGFMPLDAGSLHDSWRQQPGTPAYCTELTASDLTSALQSADRTQAPHNRDAVMKHLVAANYALTHEEMLALNRATYQP